MASPDRPAGRNRKPGDQIGVLTDRIRERRFRQGQPELTGPLFGFVQIELTGALRLEKGRYLERRDGEQRVLVIDVEGALPPPRRRRRRAKRVESRQSLPNFPVSTVTVIRASLAYGSEAEASEWLSGAIERDATAELLAETLETLDRALAAEAAAAGRPYVTSTGIDDIIAARFGFGDGDRVSEGDYLEAFEVDARGGAARPRRERLHRTRPTARIAAIMGDREQAAACEFLVPRVRSDLDGGRVMSAALVIEVAVRATIVELDAVLDDPDHSADLDRLEEMLPALTELTDAVLTEGRAWPGLGESLEEPLSIAERVMRRRRAHEQ